jgi:hypothetical protein
MLKVLHFHRNRPYLYTFLCVLLVSWLFLLFSATCLMPSTWNTLAVEAMPAGCHESIVHTQQHNDHAATTTQDCSLKPCLDSQNSQNFGFQLDKLDIAINVIFCIFLIVLSSYKPKLSSTHFTTPPIGRRLLLIYRYCTLLN